MSLQLCLNQTVIGKNFPTYFYNLPSDGSGSAQSNVWVNAEMYKAGRITWFWQLFKDFYFHQICDVKKQRKSKQQSEICNVRSR